MSENRFETGDQVRVISPKFERAFGGLVGTFVRMDRNYAVVDYGKQNGLSGEYAFTLDELELALPLLGKAKLK